MTPIPAGDHPLRLRSDAAKQRAEIARLAMRGAPATDLAAHVVHLVALEARIREWCEANLRALAYLERDGTP